MSAVKDFIAAWRSSKPTSTQSSRSSARMCPKHSEIRSTSILHSSSVVGSTVLPSEEGLASLLWKRLPPEILRPEKGCCCTIEITLQLLPYSVTELSS